jgi:DNA-binding NtrC family response regulator
MPAQIVLVHDDKSFLEEVAAAFAALGHDIAAFERSMTALSALEHAARADVLITRLTFPPGNPNGVSLARIARLKRPGIKVLFAGREQMREYTESVGEFLPSPISVSELVERVTRMLGEQDQPASDPTMRESERNDAHL